MSRSLEELLQFHAYSGETKSVYPLYDALYYLKYGRHIPEFRSSHPEYLASKELIREVRTKQRMVQSRLSQEYPEGSIELYRGGDPRGSYWTSSKEIAKLFSEAAGSPVTSRSIPIKDIVFDPEVFKEAGVEGLQEEEYTVLGDTFTSFQLGYEKGGD